MAKKSYSFELKSDLSELDKLCGELETFGNKFGFSKTMEQFPSLLAKVCNAVAKSIDIWEERFLSDRADQCGDCLNKLGVTLI